MPSARRPLAWLIAVYLLLSCVTLAVWETRGTYRVNGDEPWYLLIASNLTRHGTLEQSRAHDAEPHERRIGAAIPAFDPANPGATHMVAGPHGRYSVHNLGLPVLISPGFALAGPLGARLTLVLAGVWVLVSVWRIAGTILPTPALRTAASAAVGLALPLLGGAGQIYPDIVAGAICLHLLCTLWCRAPAQAASWTSGCLLAFLPWLQIRYAAPALVIALALLAGLRHVTQNRGAGAVRLLLPGIVAATLLAAYHLWAFGQVSGPYGAGALRPGLTALLVLLGLHVDQNQGLLIQNPMLWLGLAGVGTLLWRNPRVGLATVATYLVLIVPNALHPNWYGGWSFSGRFGWTAAIVLMLPAVIGFGRIAAARPRLAMTLAVCALGWQAMTYVGYTVVLGADAWYNRSLAYLPTPALSAYGLLGGGLWPWLPTIYGGPTDASWHWATRHAPNAVALACVLALLVAGFWRRRASDVAFTRTVLRIAVLGVAALLAAGAWAPRTDALPHGHEMGRYWSSGLADPLPGSARVADLRGTTGRLAQGARVVESGQDAPGLLVFGALQWLERGEHRLDIDYASPAPTTTPVASAQLRPIESPHPSAELPLPGTAGEIRTASIRFHTRDAMRVHEAVLTWPGTADVRLYGIRILPVNPH